MISISIIIPVYNVEQYVRKCIESIINQDDGSASIECIIIDDSSPDNSMSIIRSIVNNYKGNISFIILTHDENRGLSAARNTGINAIHGDYVLFVDSDDWLPNGSISRFAQTLEKNPDIDLVIGCRYNTKEKSLFPNCTKSEMILNNYQIRKSFLNYQIITCSAWNKVIKANIIRSHQFHEGIIFEDTPWAYLIFKQIKNAIVIPYITYIYESNHPSSIVNTSKDVQNIPMHMRSVYYMGNAILNSIYNDLFADSLIYFFRFYMVAFLLGDKNDYKTAEYTQLKRLRKQIIVTSLKKGRWFLSSFYFIFCYPPTFYLFKSKWARRHFDNIQKTGRVISNFFEKFHQ